MSTDRLVIGVASSALFDLTESDNVFVSHGEEAYRKYQEENIDNRLAPGTAFPFIRRLLSLNTLGHPNAPLVEVVVLSRNDPTTGLRVMRSIKFHNLDSVARSIFTQGQSPFKYMPAFDMSLFLSGNEHDVREATALGLPAGRVLDCPNGVDDTADQELRIAFDFDGVLADDSSENIYKQGNLAKFHEHETKHATVPHPAGPLRRLLAGVNRIQQIEEHLRNEDKTYEPRVRVSLITARDTLHHAHERAILSLKTWGVTVNDAFFLGGMEKGNVLEILNPHIVFDDQERHLTPTAGHVPSVHIPFGLLNSATQQHSTA
ncbi:5'-nucleotidase [Nocardia neocaledoniensis]|uniref:5'-nucleotidase n=1 Tax=Nocardia neocaledoniensis TaxID=236511 RepID=UPI0024549782|nr:5'-nucleotidase [Nocardia neocaledoniensis]